VKLKAILILAAILAVVGTTYYFINRPKPTTPPVQQYYVWNFPFEDLQKVTMSLPKDNLSYSFIKHPDDREFYFDVANGPMVDNQRWGGGIPLLLSGPKAMRLILQNAPSEKLSEYGFDAPNMNVMLTLLNGTIYNVEVGNSNPEDTSYYIKLTENNDVYIVDKSWYDVLSGIVINPPYVPATLGIDTLVVSPATVNVGEPVSISVNVTNNGDVTGTFDIVLFINSNLGDMRTQTITLAARSSQVVTFTVIENTAGPYNASINQKVNKNFTVK
jgi:hypothetical protein